MAELTQRQRDGHNPTWVSAMQAARMLGVGWREVNRLLEDGTLRGYRSDDSRRSWRINYADVERYRGETS